MKPTLFQQQLEQMRTKPGFIAALDQSGGSTPKALKAYGVTDEDYTDEDEMFAQVHGMRCRIMTNEAFNGGSIIGAILFQHTMENGVEGIPAGKYLWTKKQIVPFLKIDKGLAAEANGVQLMNNIPDLDDVLTVAKKFLIFGTKERALIKEANQQGIADVVAQQLEIAKQVIAHEMVPIMEPEIDIHSPSKAEAETILKNELLKGLHTLKENELVMIKLTLPEQPNFYQELIEHPNVVRVVALSGGYSREEAEERLAVNNGIIASFSRALAQDPNVHQTPEEFTTSVKQAVEGIYNASIT
jgi:fructose-bisphosphate aldolase class I